MRLHTVIPLFAMLVAACPRPQVDTDDDTGHSDTVDTLPTDTPDDSAGDTYMRATGWQPDSGGDSTADTDSRIDSGLIGDTALCKFGEIADCRGNCFPSYFLGDGYCDDGDPLPADFDCASYQSDRGDCANVDTDVKPGCDYEIRFDARNWAGEIYWRLEDAAGNVIFKVDPNTYSVNNRIYTHPITLEDGTYTFYGGDTFTDGWHGATWKLVDLVSGHQIYEGTGFSSGAAKTWTFDVVCDRDPCDVTARTISGPTGRDVGWELYTSGNRVAAELVPGDAAANTTVDTPVDAYTGNYTLRMRDAASDGWGGGRLEFRMASGYLIGAAAIPVGTGRASGTFNFAVACDAATQPATDDPGPALTPTSCDAVNFEAVTATNAKEVSYQVIRADTWKLERERPPNDLGDNTTKSLSVNVADGLYYVAMRDAGGNGWEGTKVRVKDPGTSEPLMEFTLPGGATGGKYVLFDCPEPPVDTGTKDTGDGPDSGAPCLPDATPDCNGICAPLAYKGDGTCDDGTRFVFDFDCADHANDDGDCTQVQVQP